MKALVLNRYSQLDYQEFPAPEPAAGEVVVRVRACGVCGSDIHGWDGSTGRRQPPLIMGHEASGVIAAVGPRVERWRPGDRVTFDSMIYCGECAWCRSGQSNLCDNRRVIGVSPGDYRQHGAFAEFVALPARLLFPLPEALTYERAAMAEPVSIAVHAVQRGRVAATDTAVVVGTGMIGLLVVQALRHAGCATIIAVDIDDKKLALAAEFGAHHALRSDAGDPAAAIQQLTGGRGADVSFEVVGVTPTLDLALRALKKGGTAVLVGNVAPKTDFPLQLVVTRELNVVGSCAQSGEYPLCLDLIARGVIRVDPLISAVAPLAEGDAWFRRLSAKGGGGLMKVILQP
ncbi:MAG: galactitol-1-phosphate 5-dehydrogenase [Verrucomicrobia bacterium]|nr:galactitol-1-phosphate 5-dehydrogenase [Verrucomicrobiota bacterium]